MARPHTHKGWFLLCPIVLGALDTEAPFVDARCLVPRLWLDLNFALFSVLVTLIQLVNPAYEPLFPFLVTGELRSREQ